MNATLGLPRFRVRRVAYPSEAPGLERPLGSRRGPSELRSRVWPYRFYFYSGDRDEPPHVHVARDANLAKYWLDPVRLAWSRGFSSTELRRIEAIVGEHATIDRGLECLLHRLKPRRRWLKMSALRTIRSPWPCSTAAASPCPFLGIRALREAPPQSGHTGSSWAVTMAFTGPILKRTSLSTISSPAGLQRRARLRYRSGSASELVGSSHSGFVWRAAVGC